MKIRDKIWLWGQTAGSHHNVVEGHESYLLPGVNKMTPVEGAHFFGISNICRVVMGGLPALPWDGEADELDEFENVVWSVVGSSCSGDQDTVEEVLRLRKTHTNIAGAILDDFFNTESRLAMYTPQVLAGLREKLAPLTLWSVLYEYQLDEKYKPYLAEVDKVTFWTWRAERLAELEENFAKVKDLTEGKKDILLGVYLYDYGGKKQLTDEQMKGQLEIAYRLLKAGEIKGIIICSNCIADIGLKACDIMKEWIDEHGDEEC